MTYTYTELTLPLGNKIIQRTDENNNLAFIPTDPANSDYQAYLATLPSELSTPTTPQAGA